jgi:hypothetical protein
MGDGRPDGVRALGTSHETPRPSDDGSERHDGRPRLGFTAAAQRPERPDVWRRRRAPRARA